MFAHNVKTEEWFAEVLQDSLEMDWTASDGARAIMRALESEHTARPDAGDEDVEREWPLKAKVWKRTSVEPHEWVLEIVGTIGDTAMSCRHTQSLNVDIEDVPGLPELHDLAAMREGVDRGMVEITEAMLTRARAAIVDRYYQGANVVQVTPIKPLELAEVVLRAALEQPR